MQDYLVTQQLITLAMTVFLGIGIALGFDALSVFRQYVHLSKPLQFILDLLYCVFAALFVFAALVANNWGEVRAYVFIGLGIGAILYLLLFHRFCRHLMVRVAECIRAVCLFVAKPFIWFFHKLAKLARFTRNIYRRNISAGKHAAKKISTLIHRKKKE